MATKKSKRTEPNLRIFFEESEPTKEETVNCLLELMGVMLEGYQEMVDRGIKLDEDTKQKVDSSMPLLPVIKRVIKDYKKKENK